MGRFLAILNGAADKAEFNEQRRTEFMSAWAADSHDAAVQIFSDHPHLALLPGNSIEVLECPSVPS